MGNPYKIKRHNRIYRRSAKSIVMRIAVAAVTVGFLFGIGWILYSPVTEFIGQQREKSKQDSSPIENDTTDTPDAPAPEVTTPQAEPQKEEEPIEQDIFADVMTGATAFLPNDIVRNQTSFTQELVALKAKGYTSVMVGLKLIDGTVTYNLSYKSNIDPQVTANNIFDLKEVCDQIIAAGLQPIASIHTFKDHLYSLADKSSATKYIDGDYFWVDDSLQNGGKPWLNPFADSAQAYIQKLVDDAITAGFQGIVLESLQFPEGYSLDKINYGADAATDKQEFLKNYLSKMASYAATKKVFLTAAFPSTSLLGGKSEPYFGDIAAILGDETIVLEFTPSLFGNSFTTDQLSIPTPLADPYNTVKTASAAATARLPQNRMIALIKGSGLTEDKLSAQIKGLTENGITSYIVTDPPTN